jgi:dTMP kinase
MPEAAKSGRLIALDGIRGSELLPSARRLLRAQSKTQGGFSTWDASSIFFEMHGLDVKDIPSPRTLALLYAADLHFRLRWQILPALESGQTVVAAPYVETGMAFGLALDIPQRWLRELFRFAPKPYASFWLKGPPAARAVKTAGFIEFCNDIVPKDFYTRFTEHFSNLEKRKRITTLTS